MPTERLTKRSVDAADIRVARYTIFDAGDRSVKGFGLRVFPSGKKSWVLEYRPFEGGRRAAKKRLTLGPAGDNGIPPETARKQADRALAQVRGGSDPQAEKAAARDALTVVEIAKEFLSDHVEAKRKSRTHRHYQDIIDRLIVPSLGTTKAKDVKRSAVARLHLDWRATPFQANRALAVLGSMFTYASRKGLVPEGMNPARGVERYPEDRRERFLSLAELDRLGAAIREAETIGVPWTIDPARKTKHLPKGKRQTVICRHAAAALRLLIFTGARVTEILHLRWSEVDEQRGLLLLPTSKTGRKTIVLNAPALEVLSGLPRIGVYVIAGDSAGTEHEKPRADLKRPWTIVSRRAGLDGLRLHDLRHTFASYGAGGGLGLPVIGKLLGHSEARTTQRYAHLDADPLRRASDAIGATIAAAMGEGKSSGEVIPLRKSGGARDGA